MESGEPKPTTYLARVGNVRIAAVRGSGLVSVSTDRPAEDLDRVGVAALRRALVRALAESEKENP